MGTTRAIFDARADESVCTITIGGDTVTLPSDYITAGSYVFTSDRTIEGYAGLYTTAVGSFGWGDLSWHYPGIYIYDGAEIFSSLTQIADMTIGVKEMDLRLHDGVSYQGTDTNCEGNASGNSFSYKAKNSPASASGATVYTHAKWTNLGINYKHIVDLTMMDGAAQSDPGSTSPEFTDIASNINWTGLTSPLIVYDGTWELKMYELDGSIMDSYSPETDHSGTGASWARSNPAPEYLSLKIYNPEAYNDTDLGTTDDHRVQFVYPREQTGITWSLATTVNLDSMAVAGSLGSGGWTAIDCVLTETGGNLVVTSASTVDAHIYRADFVTDADIRKPKHWSGHRFTQLTATTPDPFALTLTVKRTGGADTSRKVFSHPATVTGGGIWDICYEDSGGGIDATESYIDQVLPLDTAWIDSARQSNELSVLSWSWGIGAFDRVEISGFASGQTYTLTSLDTIYWTPSPSDWGQITYVQPECNRQRSIGSTVLNADPLDNIVLSVWRHVIGIVNGRYSWEAPSTRLSVPQSGVEVRANYSLKEVFTDVGNRWPIDDYEAYTFTLTDIFVAGDWDADLSEYTNERVLFAADVCPIWFCLSKPQGAEHDNAHLQTIMVAPLYDEVTVYPSWGDGTGTTTRTGWVTLHSVKRVRGRFNGILFDDYTPSVDTVSLESAYTENITSDNLGYYRSGDHKVVTRLTKGTLHTDISPKNRIWNRVCLSLPVGAIWLNACVSRQTGRVYVVYSLGGATKLRIFDYGNKKHQDRDVKSDIPEHSCGVCFTAGRKAGLTVVYDLAGSVYRTESFSEGKNWSSSVSIATGTCPQVCYSEQARLEITTYFVTDSIYCKIKKGEGPYGSAILIATSDEAPAAITVLPGTREHKILAELVQSGVINRYVSKDDGKTWAIEA
jgi:hypothetical protein